MGLRKIIRIDEKLCNGCGECITDCAEGALELVDGKARVVREALCDGFGACVGVCPTGALTIVERDAEDYSEKAVEERLQVLNRPPDAHQERLKAARKLQAPAPAPDFHGCPGSRVQSFESAASDAAEEPVKSELAQWPIQLRLLPTDGRLYDGRDVVLLADCVPAAFGDVQRKLIKDKTVIMTCPKLDNQGEIVDKLTLIFSNRLKSVTAGIMEVPCCHGLVKMAEEALRRAGSGLTIQVEKIGIRGELRESYRHSPR